MAIRILAFLVPALLGGGAVLLLTSGGAPPPREAPTASTPISAVPAVEQQRSPEAGRVRRVVTGHPSPPIDRGPQPTEERPAVPASVTISALGIDAPIKPVGSTGDGIRVPPVYEAGWYRRGPRPGEPGRAIVLGHLDSIDGPAAFTPLPGAEPGVELTITDRAGVAHGFRVLRTLEVPKATFPTREVYGGSRRPSLALITCGGDFDPETGYEDNVIVFARALRRD